MFSRDEMQRAIEDALKSMEGVALELYRRGREEAREELEAVKRERTSCPDCAMWAERSARWHDDMQRAERERDEARAEVERQRELKDYLRTWLSSEELEGLRVKAAEHPLLWEEIHHLKAEVERLREMAHDFEAMREDRDEARAELSKLREDYDSVVEANVGLLDGAPYVTARAAFRRGAEAMREACARWMSEREGISQWVYDDALSALPIPPEEP